MNDIRVTYSGLISFAIRLVSVITGLVVTMIITRTLSTEEFGAWGLINGLMIYGIILSSTIEYWVVRETARNENSAKTAIVSSTFFSAIGILIYLIISFFVAEESNVNVLTVIFAAILIPFTFVNNTLSSFIRGFKPEGASYGFLVFELIKIPAVIIFVYYLQMGVEGAILGVLISYIANIAILFKLGKNKIKSKYNVKYLKKWIRLFWIPIYRMFPGILSLSDVIIFSVITGSVTGVAYFTAARIVATIVSHARFVSYGLYPKLLEGGKQEHLQENLIQLFYFAIPLMSLSISLSKPALFALNPLYAIAYPVIIFLTFRAFLSSVGKIFFDALQGIEKVDLDKDAGFREFAKSKLMWYPTLQFVRNGTYFISLGIIFYILVNNVEEIELVIYWAMIGFIIEVPLMIFVYFQVRKHFTLNIDTKRIVKFVVSAIVSFGLTFWATQEFLIYNEKIIEFAPQLMAFALIGIMSYLGLTYLLDKKTRIMFTVILHELKPKKRKDD